MDLGTPRRNPLADIFLLESELAKRWRRSPRTLQRWRENGTGPVYVRLGGRVLYRLQDVVMHENLARNGADERE
jgi:hypothetical protein